MARMLGVLEADEVASVLAKAAADKIAKLTPEQANSLLAEQNAEAQLDDPEKVAADNQAMGRFSFVGLSDTIKLAGELLEEGHKLPEVLAYLEEQRAKFAAEIDEIPDDADAIDLAAKIDDMASKDPAAVREMYDSWAAKQTGDGGEAGGEGGSEE